MKDEMRNFLDWLNCEYNQYVNTYRVNGELSPMMELKLVHTGKVVENAAAIAQGEGFSDEEAFASLAAALLHDTGRYEQLRLYNTFRDSESVDHAVFSHDIVREKGWLSSLDDGMRDAVLTAVLVHNRREIDEPAMMPVMRTAAKTVRDADKLDIFRVLEHRVENTDWRKDSTSFWNLPVLAHPNPAVVDAIKKGRQVDYQDIKTLADFVLIQVGWMMSGLYYATSRRLCASRGHLEYRRRFLHELTDDPVVDEICDMARSCKW